MSRPLDDPFDRLPHRPPFRFLTRVDQLEPGVRASGTWLLRGDEDFFRGHFPGQPLVPGVLIAEALAQLSGLIAANPAGSGRLARIDVRFRQTVSPPAEIHLESRHERTLGTVSMYDVTARAGGTVIAEGAVVLGVSAQP